MKQFKACSFTENENFDRFFFVDFSHSSLDLSVLEYKLRASSLETEIQGVINKAHETVFIHKNYKKRKIN